MLSSWAESSRKSGEDEEDAAKGEARLRMGRGQGEYVGGIVWWRGRERLEGVYVDSTDSHPSFTERASDLTSTALHRRHTSLSRHPPPVSLSSSGAGSVLATVPSPALPLVVSNTLLVVLSSCSRRARRLFALAVGGQVYPATRVPLLSPSDTLPSHSPPTQGSPPADSPTPRPQFQALNLHAPPSQASMPSYLPSISPRGPSPHGSPTRSPAAIIAPIAIIDVPSKPSYLFYVSPSAPPFRDGRTPSFNVLPTRAVNGAKYE